MLKINLQILFLIFPFWLNAQLYKDSIAYYNQKVTRFLDKEKTLKEFYDINEKGIHIYTSSINKAKKNAEFFLEWNDLDNFRKLVKITNTDELQTYFFNKKFNYLPDTTVEQKIELLYRTGKLKGIKIAIDPGHIAGDMETGKLESKFLSFKKDSSIGLNEPVNFSEGEHTLATAKFLQKKLEQEGAEVMLTRNSPNESAFGCTFDEWFDIDFTNKIESYYQEKKITLSEKIRMLDKSVPREIFRNYFLDVELKERARKINSFNPDITVIIHYNVDEKNTGWRKPTNKNFTMTFIPGYFVSRDMKSKTNRLEFLRLLVTRDLENSLKLSKLTVDAFERILNIPIAKSSDADYLRDKSMFSGEPGVFSRNLALNRLVHSPLVYGESLYQDNINECKMLSKKEVTVEGLQTSKRVQQVADAYFEAVMKYFSK